MNDLESLIKLMEKYTFNNFDSTELDEEDAAAAASSTSTSSGGGYPTVTKWETGLTRSVANTIDNKVTWKSLNKLTRGKANTLL
jgi:hypothetical protein